MSVVCLALVTRWTLDERIVVLLLPDYQYHVAVIDRPRSGMVYNFGRVCPTITF